MFRLNIFLKPRFIGKCLRISLKNSLPIFVLTFKLKGGLNQITFLFRFRLVFWDGFSNFSVAWYAMFLSAVLYVVLPLLNSVLSQDKLEMRLLVIAFVSRYLSNIHEAFIYIICKKESLLWVWFIFLYFYSLMNWWMWIHVKLLVAKMSI